MADRSVLIIAGTDSSGGAGLLRDIAAARDHGLHTRCVVTAVTAQTDRAVEQSLPMPAGIVAAQLETGLSGRAPDAVKIGMLGTAEIVMAVVRALAGRNIPVVLDPVLSATSGGDLLTAAGVAAMMEHLLPLCCLVTPNLPEAVRLTGLAADTQPEAVRRQAERLRALGAGAVLVKGGHGQGRFSTDDLFDAQGHLPLSLPRLAVSRRGTGCTLSTAITCELAAGRDLRQACAQAKTYTRDWMAAEG